MKVAQMPIARSTRKDNDDWFRLLSSCLRFSLLSIRISPRGSWTSAIPRNLFNILNHPNFTNPDGGICSSINYPNPFLNPNGPITCTPNPNFGRSSQTIADVSGGAIGNGTARQVQFSLKVMF